MLKTNVLWGINLGQASHAHEPHIWGLLVDGKSRNNAKGWTLPKYGYVASDCGK